MPFSISQVIIWPGKTTSAGLLQISNSSTLDQHKYKDALVIKGCNNNTRLGSEEKPIILPLVLFRGSICVCRSTLVLEHGTTSKQIQCWSRYNIRTNNVIRYEFMLSSSQMKAKVQAKSFERKIAPPQARNFQIAYAQFPDCSNNSICLRDAKKTNVQKCWMSERCEPNSY